MGAPLAKTTLEDFLRWENEQPDKHEYHRGEIFAMVGGRRVHGCVVSNLARALGNALHGSDRPAPELASVACSVPMAEVFDGVEAP